MVKVTLVLVVHEGVYKNLTFKKHAQHVYSKLSKFIVFLNVHKYKPTKQYNTLTHPYLTYNVSVCLIRCYNFLIFSYHGGHKPKGTYNLLQNLNHIQYFNDRVNTLADRRE